MIITIKTPGCDLVTLVLDTSEVNAILATMGPSVLPVRERVVAWAEKALLDALERAVVEHAAPYQHEAKMD